MSDAEMFQDRLFEAAVREGKAFLAALVDQYPEERFYAFAFYTNNDLRGVYPFVNSMEGLERRGIEVGSEEQWIPSEWDVRLAGDPRDPMPETTSLLIDANDAFTDDDVTAAGKYGAFEDFRLDTCRSLSRALLAIRESGVFDGYALHDQIAFWVHVGDPSGDDAELMFRFVVDHLAPQDLKQLRGVYEFD